MMNIAVACDGKSLSDRVSDHLGSCRYLLIVDMDTMSVKAIENTFERERSLSALSTSTPARRL